MSNAGFQGMNTDEGRQTARNMDKHAAEVSDVTALVGRELGDTLWKGPDAERFRNDWTSLFSPQLDAVVQSLHENADRLRMYAERQDEASR